MFVILGIFQRCIHGPPALYGNELTTLNSVKLLDGMDAGRAACMFTSKSSFTTQFTPSTSATAPSSSASSSCCSSTGSPAIASFSGKNSGHNSRSQQGDPYHQFSIMASSERGSLTSSETPTTSAPTSASSAIDFLMLCQRLKTTKRAGWVNHGLKETESIADHMHRMAVMAIIAADIPGIDRDKCVKMAVVHDIAEGKAFPFQICVVHG
ncbi:hypothetical protein L7F22_068419 [Adiantum nelumboides]|nr:hypothetical protein [Adiantum nelumboides]